MGTKKYVILFMVVPFLMMGQATTVFNDGVALRIDAVTDVYCDLMGFQNQTNGADGTIDNQGDLFVELDWTNNAVGDVFSTDAGTTHLVGATAQQAIGGTATTNFYNLILTNTFGTKPQFTMDENIGARNDLTMSTPTFVDAGGGTFTIGRGAAAGEQGTLTHAETAAAGYFYNGSLARYFETGAAIDAPGVSTEGFFPLGHYVVAGPVDFYRFYNISSTVNPTTGGTVTISHTHSDGAFVDPPWIDDVTIERTKDAPWAVSTGGGMAGGTYDVQVEGNGFGQIAAVSDLRLTQNGSAVGTVVAAAGSTTDPIVKRGGLTFGELTNSFYVSSIDYENSSLPVELLSFDVKKDESQVNLLWRTASEINNYLFSIERSIDGIHFEEIDYLYTQAEMGNSTTVLQYDFTDFDPLNGITYYRLKQIDRDGTYAYSEVKPVEFGIYDNNEFVVFPNPSNRGSFFNVQVYGNENEEVMLVVNDSKGAQIHQEIIYLGRSGQNNFKVNNPLDLAVGVYTVTILNEKSRNSKMLIIR